MKQKLQMYLREMHSQVIFFLSHGTTRMCPLPLQFWLKDKELKDKLEAKIFLIQVAVTSG